MKATILFLLLIVVYGCTGQNEKKTLSKKQSKFYTIDFAEILKEPQKVSISNIAKSVEYIVLETLPKSFVVDIKNAQFTKDYIFIQQRRQKLIYQFDRKGNFIRTIGNIGRGPEEYNLLMYFSIDEKNRLVYIQTNPLQRIMVYSFEGIFVEKIHMNTEIYGTLCWSRDSLFIQHNSTMLGNEKCIFIERNYNGDTLQATYNYCFWPWKDKIYGYSPDRNDFYRFENRLHFKASYNDTIYTYNSKNKIIPKFWVDLKQHKLPDELRFERGYLKRHPAGYYFVNINESSNYVFINYSAYASPLDDGYMYYDKKSETGYALGNNGYINDLDGGPDFMPNYTNDSSAFHFINAFELKAYLESEIFLKSKPKFPNQKEMLIKRMKNLTENDNPVLMVAKLK